MTNKMEEKNVFNNLEPKEKLPEEHKKEVIKSIEAAKLALDLMNLFIPTRAVIESSIIDIVSKKNINNINSKKNK